MKHMRYAAQYVKFVSFAQGDLIQESVSFLSIEELQRDAPTSLYVVIGFNDLTHIAEDQPTALHTGRVTDLIVQPGMKIAIPIPEYVNTENGARSYYTVFVLSPSLTVEAFMSKFRTFWAETQGKVRKHE